MIRLNQPYILLPLNTQLDVSLPCFSQSPFQILEVELKSVIKGTKLNERFRSSETVEKAEVEEKKFNFLYLDGESCHFMDNINFEQVEIPKSVTGEKYKLLITHTSFWLESACFEPQDHSRSI